MANQIGTPLSTISDVENAIQVGLEALRNAPLSEKITAALSFLTPDGFTPVIQLEEDGRKKRNTAAASNWSPANGEILIYFEPKSNQASSAPIAANAGLVKTPRQPESSATVSSPRYEQGEASDAEIRECCEALAEAEAGKLFVALTWFRDKELPRHHYSWTASVDSRQRVLACAIDTGAILLGKTPNPKSDYPTSTVRLNRSSEMQKVVPSRFHPVPVRGEPVSTTIMRERGSL
ncbi:MAG: hypothetical protein JST61_15525 [Acidobacteria bacterium]|nr:hypothetical protein [Acidobacteriota bacterium]